MKMPTVTDLTDFDIGFMPVRSSLYGVTYNCIQNKTVLDGGNAATEILNPPDSGNRVTNPVKM